jgi:integrase
VASVWLERRATGDGIRYRVRYRLGGREAPRLYAGVFRTMREARARRDWVAGELAARRVPDLSTLAAPAPGVTLREAAQRWQASRVDVRESTRIQHRTALGRVLPILGDKPVDEITPADVADLVAHLAAAEKARESIRKSVTALAMALDYGGVAPNPARDRVQVRLPLAEPEEPEPPSAEHVEAAAWLLTPAYMVATLVLEATGCRVGELEAARVGDLDETRQAWLVRAAVSKTRRARWVNLPCDRFQVIVDRLPAPEDRDAAAQLFPGVTSDRLRMAIRRACRDAGVPVFAPHSLRHRYISLAHKQGDSWAEIGERVGQRSRLVTADRYSHALVDYRPVNRPELLERSSLGLSKARAKGQWPSPATP